MANQYEVGLEITADTNQAEKGLQKTSTALDEVSKSGETAAKAFRGLEKGFADIGKSLQGFGKDLSTYVTAPLAGFAALAVREFIQAEREINNLNTALRNSGQFSAAAVRQFQVLADELERTTTFSGGAVTNAAALATNFTKTAAETEKLVKAATDLSAATGMDLDSAVQALGQSLNGVSGALARTVPQVRNLTEAQLRAGVAVDYVAERFSGSAVASAQTLGGQLAMLKNNFDAFLETIGTDLQPIVQGLVGALQTAVAWLRNMDDDLRRQVVTIGLAAAAIGPLLVGIGTLSRVVGVAMNGFRVLVAGFQSFITILMGPAGLVLGLAAVAASVAGLINLFLDLKETTGSAGQAFILTWRWATAQFQQFVLVPILTGLQKVYDLLSRIPGVGSVFADSSRFVGGIISSLNAEAANIDMEVAQVFEGTGKTAARSFTFGLSDTLSGLSDQIKDSFTLPVTQGLDEINHAQAQIEEQTKKASEKQNQYANLIASSFANSFQSISDGTKNVAEAFGDMAVSILQDLSRMIIQQSIYNAISGFFGPATGTAGAAAPAAVATGGFFNGRDITHRYAEGGMVRGPGSGTSDSIPARLSNGEFVSDAKTVSYFGPDFFLNLKRMSRSMSRPSPILNGVPAFANGGYVQGSGSGDTRVVIQNSGQPKNSSSVTTEQDAQGTVVNIILEDIQKNGSISKSFQTNYGLKRGGV